MVHDNMSDEPLRHAAKMPSFRPPRLDKPKLLDLECFRQLALIDAKNLFSFIPAFTFGFEAVGLYVYVKRLHPKIRLEWAGLPSSRPVGYSAREIETASNDAASGIPSCGLDDCRYRPAFYAV